MKSLVLVLLLCSCSGVLLAQKSSYKGFPSLVWPKLYDIAFVKSKDAHGEFDKPVFSEGTKSLAGKTITLPGYMVPFTSGLKSSEFMLSSLPLNACFFCGVGGPETVVQVILKKEVAYTDKPIEVQGVLELNDKNPDQMIYILRQAEIAGEPGL